VESARLTLNYCHVPRLQCLLLLLLLLLLVPGGVG
jgi:hypothetical protein